MFLLHFDGKTSISHTIFSHNDDSAETGKKSFAKQTKIAYSGRERNQDFELRI